MVRMNKKVRTKKNTTLSRFLLILPRVSLPRCAINIFFVGALFYSCGALILTCRAIIMLFAYPAVSKFFFSHALTLLCLSCFADLAAPSRPQAYTEMQLAQHTIF